MDLTKLIGHYHFIWLRKKKLSLKATNEKFAQSEKFSLSLYDFSKLSLSLRDLRARRFRYIISTKIYIPGKERAVAERGAYPWETLCMRKKAINRANFDWKNQIWRSRNNMKIHARARTCVFIFHACACVRVRIIKIFSRARACACAYLKIFGCACVRVRKHARTRTCAHVRTCFLELC